MMRSPSARSYDIEAAGKLSRRLAGEEQPQERVSRVPPRYVRFRAGQQLVSATEAPLPVLEEKTDPALPSLPLDALDTWDKLLAWSSDIGRASAAFVVDSQGFVVATRGDAASNGFVGVGADLCYAIEQLDRIEPEAGNLRSVDIEFSGQRMTALKVDNDEGQMVIISFVAPIPMSDDIKRAIHTQAEATLPLVT
jgi:hypothetical protein